MKAGKGKLNGKEVIMISLDSISKEEKSLIYQFLGESLYPHSQYYILPVSDKKIIDRLRDAMIKNVYNSAFILTQVMNATSIQQLIDIKEKSPFAF